MGFYGNIADTTRIHFQFDKIFSSRCAMDDAVASGADNVFAGRFVLVQYDPEGAYVGLKLLSGFRKSLIQSNSQHEQGYTFSLDSMGNTLYGYVGTLTPVESPSINNWNSYYYKDTNAIYKLSSSSEFDDQVQYYTVAYDVQNPICMNQIIQARDGNTGEIKNEYWQCNGGISSGGNHYATFKLLASNTVFSTYISNYQADKQRYNIVVNNNELFDIRGYDGTVWQKVYSGGRGKFVLIARLSASYPRMVIKENPPQLFPSNVSITDFDGTTAQLNVPSHWGFKIKEAESQLSLVNGEYVTTYPYSDQIVDQEYASAIVDNIITETAVHPINADIYFNMGGPELQKQQIYHRNNTHKDTTSENFIKLTPTGESGRIYSDTLGNITTEDMLELSIHMPIIGNMIDDGYDMIYGKNANNSRPRDVEWYNGTDSDALKENGNALLGGKSYDLNTLAGSINTMHTALGQIIVNRTTWPSLTEIAELSEDYIYKYQNGYYRKGKVYTPTVVPETDYIYQPQSNVTNNDYKLNKYFIKSNGRMVEATGNYDPNIGGATADDNKYHLKKISKARYKSITLLDFDAKPYYYKQGEDYIRDHSQHVPSFPTRTYYSDIVTANANNGQPFSIQYVADGSFYTEESGNYVPSFSANPNTEIPYYTISPSTYQNGQRIRYYRPNCYYYQYNDGSYPNQWFLANDQHVYNASLYTYYVFTFSDVPQFGLDSEGHVVQYYELLEDDDRNRTPVSLLYPVPENTYALVNGTYVAYDNIESLGIINGRNPYTEARTYYALHIETHDAGTLYMPNVYYYLNGSGDYILDTEPLVQNRYHLLITSVSVVPESTPFYLPDTYWYEVATDEYEKDSSATKRNVNYYTKKMLFVYNDTTNQCPYGYEWSDYSLYIPPSISLCTFEENDGLIEMKDFGSDHSLYGLLLRLSKLYSSGNGEECIRDSSTVRGIYNNLRDGLYQIRTLKPGKVLTVNDFGQIESTDIDVSSLVTH